MQSRDAEDYEFDLIACGNKAGVRLDRKKLKFIVHCDDDMYTYGKTILFGVDPAKVSVSEDNKVKFTFLTETEEQTAYDKTEFEIEI